MTIPALAQQLELEGKILSTYHPSPVGEYKHLFMKQLQFKDITDPGITCSNTTGGTTFFDSSVGDNIQMCIDEGGAQFDWEFIAAGETGFQQLDTFNPDRVIFTEEDNLIIPKIKLGIGTTEPGLRGEPHA